MKRVNKMVFDRVKLKMMMKLINELAPDMEFKIVEKAKFDGKVWMAFLMRDKEEKKAEKDERCADHH